MTKSTLTEQIRKAISSIAQAQNTSVPSLAKNAGLHYDTLRKFLNGTSDTTITRLENLAAALGYSVYGLILYSSIKKELFWSKVDVQDSFECWNWKGGKSDGYGVFWVGDTNIKAHRIAWLITKGDIKEMSKTDYRGTCVLHKCDNRRCVNPDHLYLGTHQDNMNDRERRNRGVVPDTKGSRHGMAVLTEDDIKNIRSAYPGDSQRSLAKKYHVAQSTISDIVNRKTWGHI